MVTVDDGRLICFVNYPQNLCLFSSLHPYELGILSNRLCGAYVIPLRDKPWTRAARGFSSYFSWCNNTFLYCSLVSPHCRVYPLRPNRAHQAAPLHQEPELLLQHDSARVLASNRRPVPISPCFWNGEIFVRLQAGSDSRLCRYAVLQKRPMKYCWADHVVSGGLNR
jgi:hypothetical protein